MFCRFSQWCWLMFVVVAHCSLNDQRLRAKSWFLKGNSMICAGWIHMCFFGVRSLLAGGSPEHTRTLVPTYSQVSSPDLFQCWIRIVHPNIYLHYEYYITFKFPISDLRCSFLMMSSYNIIHTYIVNHNHTLHEYTL